MELPIHDNIGEVDPKLRQENFAKSVTAELFVEYAKRKTFEQLISETAPRSFEVEPFDFNVPGGPKLRYVQDPTNPGMVIDMVHFMESAQFPFFSGELFGAAVEVDQAIKDLRRPGSLLSAFEREDFKSNFLGSVFRTYYFEPNGDLSDQFQEFFTTSTLPKNWV